MITSVCQDKGGLTDTYVSLGNYYKNNNDFDLAAKSYLSAQHLIKGKNYQSTKDIQIHLHFANLCLKRGAVKDYKFHYKNYLHKLDSINVNTEIKYIAQLNFADELSANLQQKDALSILNKLQLKFDSFIKSNYDAQTLLWNTFFLTHYRLGNYDQSYYYALKLEKLYLDKRIPDKNLGIVLNTLATAFDWKLNKVKSRFYYEILLNYTKINQPNNLPIHIKDFAFFLKKQGDTIGYLNNMDHAIELTISLYGENSSQLPPLYYSLGRFGLKAPHYISERTSLEYMKRSREINILHRGITHRDSSKPLRYIIYYILNNKLENQYTYALKLCNEGLCVYEEDYNINIFNLPDIKKLPTEHNFVILLSYKTDLLMELFRKNHDENYAKALLKTIKASLYLQDKLIRIRNTKRSQYNYLNSYKKGNTTLLQSIIEYYNTSKQKDFIEAAFGILEHNKAASLKSSLDNLYAKQLSSIPNNLLLQEMEIIQALEEVEKKLNNIDNQDSIQYNSTEELRNRKITLKHQQYQLMQSFERNFPQYYKLKYQNKESSISEIQNKLSNNQVVINYISHGQRLSSICITKDDVKATNHYTEYLKDNCISTKVRTFLKSIHSFNSFNINEHQKAFNKFVKNGRDLYDELISPYEKEIKNKEIIVLADEDLHYLPFELLLKQFDSDSSNTNYKSLPYLLRYNPISYAYSNRLLFQERLKSKSPKNKIISFAPSYNGSNLSQNLNQLKWNSIELKNISKFMNNDIYEGENATEANFKLKADQYKILHLAMHTELNEKEPLYSKFVFNTEADSINKEDNLLHMYEIYNSQLNADLTVLSACNTGIGKIESGDGVINLARGFLYAGCPSVVFTLWPAADKSSMKLTTSFYKFLKQGHSKAKALQLAKLEYLENSDQLLSHPKYWGSFVQVGNPEPIFYEKKWLIVGSIILSVVLSLIFYKRFSRKIFKNREL